MTRKTLQRKKRRKKVPERIPFLFFCLPIKLLLVNTNSIAYRRDFKIIDNKFLNLSFFLILIIFSQNICYSYGFSVSRELEPQSLLRGKLVLSDFSQFDLVINNSHLGTSKSSSKIDFFRVDDEIGPTNYGLKYIYTFPQNFDCFDFDFSIQFDIQFFDIDHIGYIIIHFVSYYDQYNIGYLNTGSIARTMIFGMPNNADSGYDVSLWSASGETENKCRYYSSNTPDSVLCWGNRTSTATELCMKNLDFGSTIISGFFMKQSDNNLKYISLEYMTNVNNDNFNATASNISVVFYSDETTTIIDTNLNTSYILGLTLPVIVGTTLFLGVFIIVFRKRREY